MLDSCKLNANLPHSIADRPSVVGGTIMAAIGILYLVFEKKVLTKSKLPGDSTAPADNILSRALVGVQVSLPTFAFPGMVANYGR